MCNIKKYNLLFNYLPITNIGNSIIRWVRTYSKCHILIWLKSCIKYNLEKYHEVYTIQ